MSSAPTLSNSLVALPLTAQRAISTPEWRLIWSLRAQCILAGVPLNATQWELRTTRAALLEAAGCNKDRIADLLRVGSPSAVPGLLERHDAYTYIDGTPRPAGLRLTVSLEPPGADAHWLPAVLFTLPPCPARELGLAARLCGAHRSLVTVAPDQLSGVLGVTTRTLRNWLQRQDTSPDGWQCWPLGADGVLRLQRAGSRSDGILLQLSGAPDSPWLLDWTPILQEGQPVNAPGPTMQRFALVHPGLPSWCQLLATATGDHTRLPSDFTQRDEQSQLEWLADLGQRTLGDTQYANLHLKAATELHQAALLPYYLCLLIGALGGRRALQVGPTARRAGVEPGKRFGRAYRVFMEKIRQGHLPQVALEDLVIHLDVEPTELAAIARGELAPPPSATPSMAQMEAQPSRPAPPPDVRHPSVVPAVPIPDSPAISDLTHEAWDDSANICDRLWQTVLDDLEGRVTRATFDNVLRGSHLVEINDGIYTIAAPSPRAAEWLQNRLTKLIHQTLSWHGHTPNALRFITRPETFTAALVGPVVYASR
jgi:hypothetical protein